MPGMTGIEAAIITRRKFPNCKIFLLSGHPATFGLLLKARELGHEFEHLGKPVHMPDLLAKVRSS
jgi:YesN/AraC family two-component response regulator